MSLLLDALKKAAEQKARQAKAGSDSHGDDKTEELSSTDDTIVSEDSTIEFKDAAETIGDDTEISEDPTQEVTVASGREGDVTEVHDQDETHRYRDYHEFADDDTHVLDDEQTIVETNAADNRTTRGDVTERTSVTGVEDDTEYDPTTVYDAKTEYDSSSDEDTILDDQDKTQQTEVMAESRVSGSDGDVTIQSGFDEDETAPIDPDDDIAEFMGDSADEPTQSIDEPTQSIDETATQTGDRQDDMSLLLAEGYQDVDEAGDDSGTKRSPHLQGENDTELEEPDSLDHWQEAATQTSTITADKNEGAGSGVDLESLRHENTIIRPDATSTHTYAPDNYDRTLVRPPSDDASRIFAGMKAEDDVLMTPDYAKRVFLSKSSANRMQHYKVYAGIAISIFLAIGIFSMFELVDEHNRIDSTLLPLKRDPMPGLIRNQNDQDEVRLSNSAVEPDVDLATLQQVENAVVESGAEVMLNSESDVSGDAAPPADSAESQTEPEPVTQVAARDESIEKSDEPVSAPVTDQGTRSASSGSLQISSSSKVSRIDQWLAEGYAAYQRGDDETAMENYARVLEVEPSNRNALLASAAIKVQNGNTASAISDYQRLLLANPKDTLALSSLISIARTAPQESETQLKLMIRDEPDSPHLNFVLANVYGAQNRWQEAQGRYFIALQNKPGDPNYAYNLAVSLEHISKPEAAIVYYERAIANFGNGLATFDKDLVDSRIEMLKKL